MFTKFFNVLKTLMNNSKEEYSNNDITQILKEIVSINQKLDTVISEITKLKSNKKMNSEKKMNSPSKSGSIIINKFNNTSKISGQTYDKKKILKKYGAIWNSSDKSWIIKSNVYSDIYDELSKCCLSIEVIENNKDTEPVKPEMEIINNDQFMFELSDDES